MNALATLFVAANALALLVLPRRWASLPLMAGACYMPIGEGLEIGPFSFSVLRLLIAVGVFRVILRGERLTGRLNRLDWMIVLWSVWAALSSAFHASPMSALVFHLGLVYDACGIYFLLRTFCTSVSDVVKLCGATAILLVPVALEMFYEKAAFHNLFSMFGGISEIPVVRGGKIRASGPFGHPILAGTVGAVCIPLMIGTWRHARTLACVGLVACVSMIVTSASSGPILSALAAIGGLLMWRSSHRVRLLRWLALVGYVALDVVMKDPAYYIIARIDIVGGSTGYHRARLIESAIEHLDEWWFAGTEYTRHWMATGVDWSANHTDITNHYVRMGVLGGLPLMFLFIAGLVAAFSLLGKQLQANREAPPRERFVLWAIGSALFSHVITCVSVSYFDQSIIFFYLTLAATASACSQSADVATVAVPAPAWPVARAEGTRTPARFRRDPRPAAVWRRGRDAGLAAGDSPDQGKVQVSVIGR